jgi:hypothetical protein
VIYSTSWKNWVNPVTWLFGCRSIIQPYSTGT